MNPSLHGYVLFISLHCTKWAWHSIHTQKTIRRGKVPPRLAFIFLFIHSPSLCAHVRTYTWMWKTTPCMCKCAGSHLDNHHTDTHNIYREQPRFVLRCTLYSAHISAHIDPQLASFLYPISSSIIMKCMSIRVSDTLSISLYFCERGA